MFVGLRTQAKVTEVKSVLSARLPPCHTPNPSPPHNVTQHRYCTITILHLQLTRHTALQGITNSMMSTVLCKISTHTTRRFHCVFSRDNLISNMPSPDYFIVCFFFPTFCRPGPGPLRPLPKSGPAGKLPFPPYLKYSSFVFSQAILFTPC